MNKRGFTLIEVLAVFVIIAILSGIGIIGYQSFFKTGEDKYYESLESDVLLAGNDYFTDHRDELPSGNEFNYISLSDLISSKYVEPLKDSKGNACTEGYVYVYRENNKYKYESCIKCGGYESKGKYCNGEAAVNKINITAVTKNTNQVYDALATYNAAKYTNGENVLVTFNMNNVKTVKYIAINTKTNTQKTCSIGSGVSCTVDIDETGTYKVTPYDTNDKQVADSQYFNVKIAKNGPGFSIAGPDKYLMTTSESNCSGNAKKRVAYTIVKDNINEEYKTIRYRINRKDYGKAVEYGEYHTINTLEISELVESGKYELEVEITNFADKKSNNNSQDTIRVTTKTKEFYVSYKINLEYEIEDGNPHPTGTHEVVKGQQYDFVSKLPTHRSAYGQSNLEVRWHPENVEYSENVRITGTTVVTAGCTYRIMGLMSIPVDVPSNLTSYCKSLTYNGSNQTLTNNPPTNITFLNNTGKDAGEYTVKAHINAPLYIWKNEWTFDDKEFKCSIGKKTLTVTATAKSKTYGDDNPAFTYSYTGNVSGETPKFTGSLATSAGKCSDVAAYSITKNTLDITDNGTFKKKNYTMSYEEANLTIDKKTITVTADDKTKYKSQENPTLTYKTSGVVCSQTDKYSGSLSTPATKDSAVGTYDINQGTLALKTEGDFKAGNYSISYVKGTLTILDPCTDKKLSCDGVTYGNCSVTYTHENGKKTGTGTYYSNLVSGYACGTGTCTADCTGATDACSKKTLSCDGITYGDCSVTYAHESGTKTGTGTYYSDILSGHKCGTGTCSTSCNGATNACATVTTVCGEYGACSVTYQTQNGTKSRTCVDYSSVISGRVCRSEYTDTTSCTGATACDIVWNNKCYLWAGYGSGQPSNSQWDCFIHADIVQETGHCSNPYGAGAVAYGWGRIEPKVYVEAYKYGCKCYKPAY